MPITPSFDLDGNMTSDGQWAFAWDAENRLAGASNTTTAANYSYDYMSRRYRKIVNVVTNNFVYDGWNLIRETSSAGVTNTYVWGIDLSGTQQGAGGIGGLLSATRNGTTYFPCYDANGNITDYVDASGAVVAHREYDAYGNTVASSGPMVSDFSFWFSSKYLDQETGLYYYGYRYYVPETGRWANRDSVVELGFDLVNASELNRLISSSLGSQRSKERVISWQNQAYLFVDNNSLTELDYFGLSSEPPVTEGPCPKEGDVYVWNRSISAWCSDKPGFPGSANGSCACTYKFNCVKFAWPFSWGPFHSLHWMPSSGAPSLSCPPCCGNISACAWGGY